MMDKIASFTVNHEKLLPGVYVSRRDVFGNTVLTTFDLRFTRPNVEAPLDTAGVHTIEHMWATFFRNHPMWARRTVYFGPMGCRTGFYLILEGELEPRDILPLLLAASDWTLSYEGEIPGYSPRDCGNYLDMNLGMANYLAEKYLDQVLYHIDDSRLIYPE